MKKVAIISVGIRPYRVSFLTKLSNSLAKHEISLTVCHDGDNEGSGLCGEWSLPGNIGTVVRCTRFGKKAKFYHLPDAIYDHDLIIMTQLSSMLVNYMIIAKRWFGWNYKTAFWGHGRNLRIKRRQAPAEFVKKKISVCVDWWFAYNRYSAEVVENLGYSPSRITEVRNSVDTTALQDRLRSSGTDELESLRSSLGIASDQVAVYTGSLTNEKRIGFLLEAAMLVRNKIKDFHLIVLGDGPLAPVVREAAARCAWIHWEGAKFEAEKVPYWAISKLLLMPGGVGLVVIDSFALGVPMVTTANRLHGPEISYLRDGENGIMVADAESAESYASAVVGLLQDPRRLAKLREGCLGDCDKYSIEEMVKRFTEGVLAALESPGYRV